MSTSPTISDYIQNALPTWLGGSPVTANEQQQNQAAAAAEIAAVATSPGGLQATSTLLANDQPLVNGQTYTFTFLAPGATVDSLSSDIIGQAPNFIVNPVVVPISGGGFNVTFIYEGDGSDVVQDVASSIVAAGLAVNNDQLGFVSASQTSTVGQVLQPTITAQISASNTDQSLLASQANAAATAQDTASLTSFLTGSFFWIVIAIVAFLFLAPKFLDIGERGKRLTSPV
ncbi:MAG TPA: hypothetical protein VKJ65_04860 [Phycisphaerae bacterium]|nr:hypothetical protein [Phycisphaerae bacterium]